MNDTPHADDPALDDTLPEQLRVRREKRAKMLEDDRQVYPVAFERTHSLAELRAGFADLPAGAETGQTVKVAGRVIFVRNKGKLCFARLRDGDGAELQAMISLDRVGEEGLTSWKSLVDIGDLVGFEGEVVSSKRGELSVSAARWSMVAKALRPLPVEHKPMSDEARVRLRYVDLLVRPDARHMLNARSTVLTSLRQTLLSRGYVEVETPMLQPIHGGASARPFSSHVNAFDRDYYFRIAIELYLKRLVVGGVHRVFEMGRIFRNEGIDWSHSPEFTMLEAYEAYGDYYTMAELARAMVLDAARAVGVRHVPDAEVGEIDLEAEWRWLPIHRGVSDALGEEVTVETPAETLRALAGKAGVELPEVAADGSALTAGEIVMEIYDDLVEPRLRTPTFVCDYPADAHPLARQHRDDPRLVEAFDLVAAGLELTTAFSELNDPVVQRQRLVDQAAKAAGGDPDAMRLDEDFLRALEYGMPPTGGIGLGIERLLMLLTGVRGIRETITFPLIKPEGGST